MTPKEIIDAIGVDKLAEALDVDRRRVLRVRNEKQIPALWYTVVCSMSKKEPPFRSFTFKGVGA